MNGTRILLAVLLLAAVTSCDRDRRPGPSARGHAPRKGVIEVEPIGEDFPAVAGQTIYVPAYSAILCADNAHPFDLAITLSIRNTDRAHPILITAVRYYDPDGRLVRDDLRRPVRVGPLAAMESFVEERDRSGGVSACFLVEWVAEQAVSDPVVEAVMIGTVSTQGISFICPGRVIANRGH
jgi:hypothetical protein